jgi:hypothetical protein
MHLLQRITEVVSGMDLLDISLGPATPQEVHLESPYISLFIVKGRVEDGDGQNVRASLAMSRVR